MNQGEKGSFHVSLMSVNCNAVILIVDSHTETVLAQAIFGVNSVGV